MNLSDRLFRNLQQTNLKPIIALELEDVPFKYCSDTLKKTFKYGDPVEYGDGVLYGALIDYPNQKPIISLEATTTSIKQTLDPDKGRGSGVSQMSIVLIDKNKEATKLSTGVYGEILYKKAKVWVGFSDQSDFNSDFILVFRGIVQSIDVGPGNCVLNLASPDDLKRQSIGVKSDRTITTNMDNVQTTIDVDNVDNLFVIPDHPAYSPKDQTLKTYVKIDDEYIRFTGITGLQLTGCIRGQLNTSAASHAIGQNADSFYELDGNAMDLALKICLSDKDVTPYLDTFRATSVNFVNGSPQANSIFFSGVAGQRDYNIRIGDYVKTQGFSDAGNNFSTYAKILDVQLSDGGTAIVLDRTLFDEASTTGTVDFLSYYNSLGDFGLNFSTDEIDIFKHENLKLNYLSNFHYKFYLRDTIDDAKSFIENELYIPASCYSLPTDRQGLARVSVGIVRPPLPGAGIITVDKGNIVDPDKIKVARSGVKYYFNAVIYQYEDTPDDQTFRRNVFVVSGTQAVPTGNRPKVIPSKGLRTLYGAASIATESGGRILQRWQHAAESISNLTIKLAQGVQIVVGDIIVLDPTGLFIINPLGQDRNRPPQLFEVINKSFDYKSGKTSLDIVNTAFNINARYGLIGPSSVVSTVISQRKFTIISQLDPSISQFGNNEYRKWTNFKLPIPVQIRKDDFSQTFDTTIVKINTNTIELASDVSFTLTGGEVMELSGYSLSNDLIKTIYAFISNGSNFPDGKSPYLFA